MNNKASEKCHVPIFKDAETQTTHCFKETVILIYAGSNKQFIFFDVIYVVKNVCFVFDESPCKALKVNNV